MAVESIVYIVDDDPIICQAIAWLLESVNIQSKTFQNAHDFLNSYDPTHKGCLVVDVRMPGMSGLELQQQLNARHNMMPLIMITGHGDVPMAVRAIQAGASDFILKPFNDQVLLEKIQIAIAQDNVRPTVEVGNSIQEKFEKLTTRERQVMTLVINGKLNKQIAGDLKISMSTVELHRARVMQKMQAKSLAELVKMAVELKTC